MEGLRSSVLVFLLLTGMVAITTAESICSLPSETGPCRAMIPRYFYDTKSGTCQMFTYGGCLGNANNFEKKENCEAACP
ncbi:PI-actitoxin-Afv2b-like [Babylonia areolata]|uniref:PI-actitoxin-Afv2b-like n=1 Tax=Babylonia areolata TaxID=304850 RepID=UPI003FD2519A